MPPSQVPQHKKARIAPKQVVSAGGGDPSEGEWTRVEKRKAKKTKKVEAKHDVCLISASLVIHCFF
jgi:RNA exonuclease 1